ncbi:hypothetical protein [Bacillus sp. EB600]|uniref:hypothetical protein n=1 Tax=Bacillus sp. EB600 TaxID=2806345 RepID=UPI00210AEDB1|nr:hypothetical protein [Bacillus sp. EB600]MCQ6279145.1 hypothetical protein [Bacillus sp. EB600]
MEKTKIQEYKCPLAALLWSFTLPGFGQIYNDQFFLGIIFMFCELGVNNFSHLNLSIMESFHGDFKKAHDLINYQWGIYYPSIWCFSMWQAYNRALAINAQLKGKVNKKYELVGLLFGFTFGMDLGIFWHFSFIPQSQVNPVQFLSTPVFSGLIIGLLLGLTGHFIEGRIKRHYRIL